MAEHGAKLFEAAAERMRLNTGLQLSNEQRLELYSYYKQATEGPCNTSKPGFFDFTGRAKWEAWNKLGQMTREESKLQYISLVTKYDPQWREKPLDVTSIRPQESNRTGATGPVVSRMVDTSGNDTIPDDQKTLMDWTSENNIAKVKELITNGQDINSTDDNGMTALHWSCDRGNIEIAQYLINQGCDINIKDNEGQTPLHYGACCGHSDVCLLLLDKGADVNLLDNDGQSPLDVSDPTIVYVFKSTS